MKNADVPFIAELKKNSIKKHVVDAFESVDRAYFFDPIFADKLQTGRPVPIGLNELSDDTLTLARMIELLPVLKNASIIELGTGSGYSAAVLSRLFKEVVTIEYHEELALRAKENLKRFGAKNVRVFAGEATALDEPVGEFDAAIITGACGHVPLLFLENIKQDATLVFIMGPSIGQQVISLKNTENEKTGERYTVAFRSMCSCDSIRGRYGLS